MKALWLYDSSEKIFVLATNFDDTIERWSTINLAMQFESGDL